MFKFPQAFLAIEPGEIDTEDYELLVKRKKTWKPTEPNTIVLKRCKRNEKKGKRFLNFCSHHPPQYRINYIKMLDGNIGIQVGN
jgi:hypothetical protein